MAIIRELEPERDAADIVAVIRATSPLRLVTVESWLHQAGILPARAQIRSLVAEVDGRVVGDAQAGLNFFGSGKTAYLIVRVLPEHERSGIGSSLYEAMLEHALGLGSPTLIGSFDEAARGVAFAERRGWRETRAEQWSVLDPRTVTERVDPSVELVPAREADLHELHRIDDETTRDVPAHEPFDAIPFEEWLDFVWRNPFFAKDGSFLAYIDRTAAALTLLLADTSSGRATMMFTGTRRAFRGRGLALTTKLATTHWAAANGITQISTTNDERNAPMLAVNRRLGYRPAGRRVEYSAERERLLGERSEHL